VPVQKTCSYQTHFRVDGLRGLKVIVYTLLVI